MTDTTKLRQKVQESGLKYKFLAQKLNLSPYALLQKIENDTEFKASEIYILQELLNLTTEEKEQIFFAQ